jgi:uncharacterized protein (TIGR00255 family)
MLKSMTGYGHADYSDDQVSITAELRSLNSKFLDLNLRLPKIFSDKEIEIRNIIAEQLERGKITLAVEYIRTTQDEIQQSYNQELFVAYYQELKKLADKVNAPYDRLFELALNSPDVVQHDISDEPTDEAWENVKKIIFEAIRQCEKYRQDEGKTTAASMQQDIATIENGLSKIIELDSERVNRIRQRITGNVKQFFGEEDFDQNRLEQEIIFYIEKLDINEEKVRLKTHLDYFKEALSAKDKSNGKKLGFISQELGREINTIGSKANDAAIQKHVVEMKEALEKMKEQLGNIL